MIQSFMQMQSFSLPINATTEDKLAWMLQQAGDTQNRLNALEAESVENRAIVSNLVPSVPLVASTTNDTFVWDAELIPALDINLIATTASTFTVDLRAGASGVERLLLVKGHPTATRTFRLSLTSGVVRMTLVTPGSTISVGTVPINGRGFYRLYWASALECIVQRVYLA